MSPSQWMARTASALPPSNRMACSAINSVALQDMQSSEQGSSSRGLCGCIVYVSSAAGPHTVSVEVELICGFVYPILWLNRRYSGAQ